MLPMRRVGRIVPQPYDRGGAAGAEEPASGHTCQSVFTMREITQSQLHNDSDEIMRELDRGESFLVTRNGTPIGELKPVRRRRFVPAEVAIAAFSGVGKIDYERFRRDVDRVVEQDPRSRAWDGKTGG